MTTARQKCVLQKNTCHVSVKPPMSRGVTHSTVCFLPFVNIFEVSLAQHEGHRVRDSWLSTALRALIGWNVYYADGGIVPHKDTESLGPYGDGGQVVLLFPPASVLPVLTCLLLVLLLLLLLSRRLG